MRNKARAGLLLFLLLAAASRIFAGTEYYVDGAKGNNSNDGSSLQTAWKTLSKANSALQAGDTVYIRGGTYRESGQRQELIRPWASGQPGNPITYCAYQSETVRLESVISDGEVSAICNLPSGINYIVVKDLILSGVGHSESGAVAIVLLYGDNNTIENCILEYPKEEWSKGIIIKGDYNTVKFNEVRYCGPGPGNSGLGEGIQIAGGDHNLIEGNTIHSCGHNCIELRGGRYNVVRGNELEGNWWRPLGFGRDEGECEWNLVEDNDIFNACGQSDWGGWVPGIQISANRNIIRKNRIYDIDGWAIEFLGIEVSALSQCINNKFFHNIVFNAGRKGGRTNHLMSFIRRDIGVVSGNAVKNNIFWGNSGGDNIYWEGTGQGEQDFAVNSWSATDPEYIDEGNRDFRLQGNSPCIDAGDFLTKTRSSGSGTQLPVEDAGYFCDGFGIVEGDLIQLEGQYETARISDINYSNNILTLDSSLSWSINQGVALAYSGSAPDIGAYEYIQANPVYTDASASPTSGEVPLTVNFTGSAWGGTPPYSYNWDFGDGQSSSEQSPSHIYSTAGNYLVYLTVTDSDNDDSTTSLTIIASPKPPPPLAASVIASPTSGEVPLTVNFTGSASGGTPPYSYSWNFGDNLSSSEQSPSHTYSTAGTYSASLTVTDSSNNKNSSSLTITASPKTTPPLAASATASPTSGQIPLMVNFTGSASGGTPPYSYSWNFGDGRSSAEQNTAHTYSSAGSFTATLTVTDSKPSTASSALIITTTALSAFTLSISSVTGAPAPGQGGTTNPTPGIHSFSSGSTVQIKSIPNSDYRFSKWTGDILEADMHKAESTILINNNKSVAANFCTKCGDLNGDLNITPQDAQIAFDIFLGKNASPRDCERENGDVNSDGTKAAPKVTPADAQAIFNKYLNKGELPSDCSGNSRPVALTLQNSGLPNLQLILSDVTVDSTGEVVVPVIIDSPTLINSFGFDLAFPSGDVEFVRLEKSEYSDKFIQIDAREVTSGKLRVGGYRSGAAAKSSSEVLVTLIFRASGVIQEEGSLTVVATYDDFQKATVRNGKIRKNVREDERAIRENGGTRNRLP